MQRVNELGNTLFAVEYVVAIDQRERQHTRAMSLYVHGLLRGSDHIKIAKSHDEIHNERTRLPGFIHLASIDERKSVRPFVHTIFCND